MRADTQIEQMLAMGSLLTGGVFERFPGLRAAFLEASCSWAPAWLWNLDERVEKFADDAQFKLTPLAYRDISPALLACLLTGRNNVKTHHPRLG